MKKYLLFTSLCALVLSAGMALADWSEGDPALFVQRPDLTSYGMDVQKTGYLWNVMLADDFSVTRDDSLRDIHIWGSWRNDVYPWFNAGNVKFSFFIYDDIPAGVGGLNYSRPGMELVSVGVGENKQIVPTSYRAYATGLHEGWYNPQIPNYDPNGDTVCWQYNFNFDNIAPQGILQLEAGKIYWLQIEALPGEQFPGEPTPIFGWKTSTQHWHDAAAYYDFTKTPLQWRELKYPSGHPLYQQKIDLSFVITPEPAMLPMLGVLLACLGLGRRRQRA